MIKLLLPIAAILIIIAFSIWKLSPYFSQNTNPQSPLTSQANTQSTEPIPVFSPLASIAPGASADPMLIKRVNDLSNSLNKITDLENRVKNLENIQTDINARVTKLEKSPLPSPSPSTATATSTSKTPVFIPINSGGSVNLSDWTNVSSGSISINPSDFPGYTSMNLIITLNVYQGNGKAFARISNASNGNGIIASETSTTNENATQITSGAFTLPSGSNSYTIQLKTLTVGYSSIAGFSFIKVNF